VHLVRSWHYPEVADATRYTVRFYALRLREVGMTKSDAKRIIAQGTDWRFFNELKRELKG
jgi:hypothetical protein